MAGTYTNLLYHIVFSTKNRSALITSDIQAELYRYMGGIIRGQEGICLEIGGVADHVHILAKIKPAISLSDFLREVKASASKWMNEKSARLRRFAWQDGYGAFSVSESQVEKVRRYIQTQERHHRKLDYKEEFRQLLRKHKIEFEEKHLWR
jgi:REP element-mobilizing transposase RayT